MKAAKATISIKRTNAKGLSGQGDVRAKAVALPAWKCQAVTKSRMVISAFLHDEQRDRTTPDHSSSALTAKKRPHKLNYQLDLDPRAPVLAHQLVVQGSTGAS